MITTYESLNEGFQILLRVYCTRSGYGCQVDAQDIMKADSEPIHSLGGQSTYLPSRMCASLNARTHICHALCLSLPQGECCHDHCDHHDDRDHRQYLRIESTATWDSIAVAEEEV